MIQHGRDTGTMEFIFAKGGNLSDMNYVMFDVQDNTWEPLIKAVAERENSHPDIIRKEAAQQQQQPQIFGMPSQEFRPAVPAAGTAVAPNRRAVQQANQALHASNQGQSVRDGSTKVGDLYGAGFKGRAAMQAGRNIMGAGKAAAGGIAGAGMAAGGAAKDFAQNTAGPAMGRAYGGAKEMAGQAGRATMDAGGRALQAVKDSGMGERMKNFMGAAGRGISDLRHAPAAAKQSFGQMRAASERNSRRDALEAGVRRGDKENENSSRRFVEGSAGYDDQMDRAKGRTSQGLARDFNITPNTNKKGKPTQSVEDAMRDEVKQIGLRNQGKTQDKDGNEVDLPAGEKDEGFMDGMKRRGEERRGNNQAQKEGAAYAPSNMGEQDGEVPPLPPGPSTAAEDAANADMVPEPENTMPDLTNGPETGTPPDPAQKPEQTATATESDPRQEAFSSMFGRQEDEQGTGYKMGGNSAKGQMQRGMDSEVDLSNVDQQLTEEMIQTLGIKDNKIGQAIMQRLRALPQYVKEQAVQGDSQAKERVEAEAEKVVSTMPDLQEGQPTDQNQLALSSKKHQASWDSVLKGLNVR